MHREITYRQFTPAAYGQVTALILGMTETVINRLRVVKQADIGCVALYVVLLIKQEFKLLVYNYVLRENIIIDLGMILILQPSRCGHILLITPQRNIQFYVACIICGQVGTNRGRNQCITVNPGYVVAGLEG